MSGHILRGFGIKALNRYLFLVIIAVLFTACGLSTEKKIAGYMNSGTEYMKAGKYMEAAIEFKNVVKLDKNNARGHYNLALVYLKLGGKERLRLAYREFLKAVEIDPGIADAQIKIGEFELAASKPTEARERAELVLKKDPESIDATLLQARAYAVEKKYKKAIDATRRALKNAPDSVKVYSVMGAVQAASGRLRAAEKSYRKAISINPGAIEPRVALANVYMSAKRYGDAEKELTKSIELRPDSIRLSNILARFYIVMKRLPEAESTYNAFVQHNRKDPNAYLVLSNFYLRTARPQKAIETLKGGIVSARNTLKIRRFLAEILLDRQKDGEASTQIEKILKEQKDDPFGFYLRGRLKLLRGDGKKAEEDLKRAASGLPDSPIVHYFLGGAYVMTKRFDLANGEYIRALELAPGMEKARLALATMYLATGDYALASEESEKILKKNNKHPVANLLAGNIRLRERKPEEAVGFFNNVIRYSPENPSGYVGLGNAYQMMGRHKDALRNYDIALSKKSEMPDVIAMAAFSEISAKHPERAVKRVRVYLKKMPGEPRVYYLLGRVYMAVGDLGKAEEALNKAIDIKNDLVGPYMDLGAIYVARGDFEEAIKRYKKASEMKPGSLPPYMMLGILYERTDKTDEAIENYKKALDINPRFAPAANNLAWLYSERGGNIDVALGLAETALSVSPDDPNIADTLGWIYYKKKAYLKAVSYLRDSAEKLPNNPMVHYHLGMAYYKRGNKKLAADEIKRSLSLKADYPGSDEARKVLDKIKKGK